jgi:hypothetical protein
VTGDRRHGTTLTLSPVLVVMLVVPPFAVTFLSQKTYTAPLDEFPKNSKIWCALDVRRPRIEIM